MRILFCVESSYRKTKPAIAGVSVRVLVGIRLTFICRIKLGIPSLLAQKKGPTCSLRWEYDYPHLTTTALVPKLGLDGCSICIMQDN